MFRGLRRLFRFRLRVKQFHFGDDGYGFKQVLGDWAVVDRKNEYFSKELPPKLTKREAKKLLRWWRKYGD